MGERNGEKNDFNNWKTSPPLRGAIRFYRDLNATINVFGLELTTLTSFFLMHYQEQAYSYALKIGNQDLATRAKIMCLIDSSITIACAAYGIYRRCKK